METNSYYLNNGNKATKTLSILKKIMMVAIIVIYSNHKLFAQAPPAPGATAATNYTCTSFNANWDPVSGAVNYFIDVSTDVSFSTNFIYNNLNVGNVLTYNITGLTIGIDYYYRVRVYDGNNTSSNSNTISANTGILNATNALAASNILCTSFDANWGVVTGAIQYFLDVSLSASFTNFVTGYNNLNVANVTTFNVTGLTTNTTYYYRLRTDNGCTTSLNSNTITVGTSDPTLSSSLTPSAICSGAPFNYTPTSATSGATFAWSRSAVAGISNTAGLGTGDPNETLINTTVSPVNVTYIYTVTANGCTNATTYSVVVPVNPIPTLTSSLTPSAIFTDHVFNYTPTSATAGTAFSWTRATVTGISNVAATGAGDPSEALFNITNSPVNVTYEYTLSANGCTNSTSYSVIVTVNTPAVWPGDANNDSLVNNVDLLSIGLHYSETGTPRANIDNTWQANIATNWGTLQTNGQDVKHADCNGDGTVDSNDTLAINLNFNLTHTIAPPAVYSQERATSDMYFVINNSAYNAGDWVYVELWLGSQTTPISDFYGIAFNINYEASLVQTGTEAITYGNSWLGTPGTDVLTITKADALANTAYGAVTRIDHTGKSGYGKIADFKFQVKNALTAEDTMHFSISNYMAIDSAGTAQTLSTGTDSISVSPLGTGIRTSMDALTISIAPNPFTSTTTITMNSEIKNSTVKIVDVLGKEVKTISFSGKKLVLEKGELHTGIYSVKIISEQKTIIANEKIIIQ